MKSSPGAGKPADDAILVDVPGLITSYYTDRPEPSPGNGASIGGLKVVTENAWFAARPSGTEAIYKIYAESFRGAAHLARVLEEAQAIVARVLAPGPRGDAVTPEAKPSRQ